MKALFFVMILSTLVMNLKAEASSGAYCKVSAPLASGAIAEIFKTPTLPIYGSFGTDLCTFKNSDNRIALSTSFMRGGTFISLRYDGKLISQTSVSVPEGSLTFSGTGFTASGLEITYNCYVHIDLNDISETIRCQ